ncbi:hypothetical protein [Flavobacterium sp. PL02]|uniref:hypothetical protein n=1 Tax=Flavobacterium sp. PL02 TaxID=3088354 RepID=UPI002B22C2B4|nr:hypothetical protein [Flavobacterium sp. PL02]MEA9411582.1 hypothetical protein [Flavobacterium sp. PL02]
MMKNLSGKALKISTIIVLFVLFGILGYSYNQYVYAQTVANDLKVEKIELVKNLIESKKELETAISENIYYKDELINEKQKVENLLYEIKNTNVDAVVIIKYKKEVLRLKRIVSLMQKEKIKLSKIAKLYKMQRDSTKMILGSVKKKNDTLIAWNNYLKEIQKNSNEIVLTNLEVQSFKEERGKFTVTDKAKKVNILKISFTIVGFLNSGLSLKKKYYVQVIDSENNILGENKEIKFGNSVLNYSYISNVKYPNDSLKFEHEIRMKEFKKGIHFVNVFDKGKLTNKDKFVLR